MVYVTGDTHADKSRFSKNNLKDLQPGDTLIVCGDFGFVWEATKKEKDFLKWLGTRKFNVCFIDGPHDNFEKIYTCKKSPGFLDFPRLKPYDFPVPMIIRRRNP